MFILVRQVAAKILGEATSDHQSNECEVLVDEMINGQGVAITYTIHNGIYHHINTIEFIGSEIDQKQIAHKLVHNLQRG